MSPKRRRIPAKRTFKKEPQIRTCCCSVATFYNQPWAAVLWSTPVFSSRSKLLLLQGGAKWVQLSAEHHNPHSGKRPNTALLFFFPHFSHAVLSLCLTLMIRKNINIFNVAVSEMRCPVRKLGISGQWRETPALRPRLFPTPTTVQTCSALRSC